MRSLLMVLRHLGLHIGPLATSCEPVSRRAFGPCFCKYPYSTFYTTVASLRKYYVPLFCEYAGLRLSGKTTHRRKASIIIIASSPAVASPNSMGLHRTAPYAASPGRSEDSHLAARSVCMLLASAASQSLRHDVASRSELVLITQGAEWVRPSDQAHRALWQRHRGQKR